LRGAGTENLLFRVYQTMIESLRATGGTSHPASNFLVAALLLPLDPKPWQRKACQLKRHSGMMPLRGTSGHPPTAVITRPSRRPDTRATDVKDQRSAETAM